METKILSYSECVSVSLFIQHAMRVCPITLPSVAWPALPYFSKLSHKRHDFLKNVTEYKMHFWTSLQLLCGTFLILRNIQLVIAINVHRHSCEEPGYACRILKKREISLWIFEKSFKFHENRPVGAELFCADRETEGQTEKMKLIVAFCNFANASKNGLLTHLTFSWTGFIGLRLKCSGLTSHRWL